MDDKDIFVPTLTHAIERDVDLLLVEELACDRDFVGYLLDRLDEHMTLSDIRVLHSVRRMQERREIDIQVECFDGTSALPLVLLIENKLSETEQPGQAESYQEECTVLVENKRAREAISVLVCPDAYARQWPDFARKFNGLIHYEDIRDWLSARADKLSDEELAARMKFRASLLEQAVSKHRRGYEPIEVESIGSFNERYVRLLSELAPEIAPGKSLSKPQAKPADSVSMIFDQAVVFASLPPEIRPRRFAHELGRGRETRANYVAATFAGWGRHFDRHKEMLARDLAGTAYELRTPRANAKRPSPGLVLFTATPPADNQGDFDGQRGAIAQGIIAADELRRWLHRNVHMLERWRNLLA